METPPADPLSRLEARIAQMWSSSATIGFAQPGCPLITRNRNDILPVASNDLVTREELEAAKHWLRGRRYGSVDGAGQWRAFLRFVDATYAGFPGMGFSSSNDPVPCLQIELLPHSPPSFVESSGLASHVLKDLIAPRTPGLVVIGGLANSGRTSSAASLFIEAARARGPGVSALTLESPVEYVISTGSLTGSPSAVGSIVQIDVARTFGGDRPWPSAFEYATRGAFDQVLLSSLDPADGCDAPFGYHAAAIARSGKSVFTTINGGSLVEVFLNLVSGVQSATQLHLICQQLRCVVVQELIQARGHQGTLQRYLHTGVLHLHPEERAQLADHALQVGGLNDLFIKFATRFLTTRTMFADTLAASRQRLPTHVRPTATISSSL